MEILIPGLILVALMVYASTKLKKSAAKALERETIENESFSIIKPEGFVHILNGDAAYAFEAYSKEFGKAGNKNVRQATVKLRSLEKTCVDKVAADVKTTLAEPILEGEYVTGLKSENDTIFEICHRIVPQNGNVFDLEVIVLHDNADELKDKIHEVLGSFRVR
jgi:hypothetical protein